jgi:hypothetical protein
LIDSKSQTNDVKRLGLRHVVAMKQDQHRISLVLEMRTYLSHTMKQSDVTMPTVQRKRPPADVFLLSPLLSP